MLWWDLMLGGAVRLSWVLLCLLSSAVSRGRRLWEIAWLGKFSGIAVLEPLIVRSQDFPSLRLGQKGGRTWNSWRFHKGLCAGRKICSLQSLSSLICCSSSTACFFEAVIWFSGSTFCGVCTGYKESGFLQLPPVTGTKLDQARRT